MRTRSYCAIFVEAIDIESMMSPYGFFSKMVKSWIFCYKVITAHQQF